ncbi:MAG: glycosyltransferase family 2 protein [Phycisphaerae bacterium]
MATRISVCIPTHNRAGLLQQALRSLMELRPMPTSNWEIIIVANRCEDHTVRLAKSMAAQLPAPLLVVEEAKPGVVAARNCAARYARGEIIAFLDDDVQVCPDWLSELIKVFDTDPPDIFIGRVSLDWHGLAKPTWFDSGMGQYLAEVNLGNIPIFLRTAMGATANLAITRTMLERVGKFRCPLLRRGQRTAGEDTDLIARALRLDGKVLYCPTAVVRHHVARERLTVRYISSVAYDVGLAEYLIARPPRSGELLLNLAKKNSRFLTRSVRWLMIRPFHRRSAAQLQVSLAKTRGNISGLILCAAGTRGRDRDNASRIGHGVSVPTTEITADEFGTHRRG